MSDESYDDPHRYNHNVHWRLYLSPRDERPAVICVQDDDYLDLEARRFLSPEAWSTEAAAQEALDGLIPPAWKQLDPDRVMVIVIDECHSVRGWAKSDEETMRLIQDLIRAGRKTGLSMQADE